MEEMLVDEPLLEDVVGGDQRDIGRIDDQEPARLQRAPVLGKDRIRTPQMLDRVARVDDVEAFVRKSRIFDAGGYVLRALEVFAGRRYAFVRLDAGEARVRCLRKERARKCAAVGSDVEHAQRERKVGARTQER